MDEGHTLRDLVRSAHDALVELGSAGLRCPEGTDRFDWSADLLDELARVALEVGEVATAVCGSSDDDGVVERARELSTAIVRRRNDALVPLGIPACGS